jgi:uncharacterized repeat protein (TIGR03803 family)
MKKPLLLILFTGLIYLASAQCTTLHSFKFTDGSHPEEDLFYDGTYLYGTTSYGGKDTCGVIFRIKPDGTGDTVLHTFKKADGSSPEFGRLYYDGTYLYGTTTGGGLHNQGNVFRIKPDGTSYTDLYDFADGGQSTGSVISDGTYLYGTEFIGGTLYDGSVFRIKPDGTGDTTLHSFKITDGQNPYGALCYDGKYLYGTTWEGGTHNFGVIYRLKTDGTGDTVIYNFPDGAYGLNPLAGVVTDGAYLYGTTPSGGLTADGGGVVFRIKNDGSGDTVLHSFLGDAFSDASNPYQGLLLIGGYLYGTTQEGGSGNGTVFSIRIDGTNYDILYDFNGEPDGVNPEAGLESDGIYLYGTTVGGGTNNQGIVFKCQMNPTGIKKISQNENEVNVYPNPSEGVFTFQANSQWLIASSKIEVYNVLGKKTYFSIVNGQQLMANSQIRIDLSNQPSGIYFYRITSMQGDAIGSGKLIKQ